MRPKEYFEPNYYAPASARPAGPAATFAAPWRGDFDDPRKILASVASTPAIDFSVSDKLSQSVANFAPPPVPVWHLTNTGPFHVFVTADAVPPTTPIGPAMPSGAFSTVPSSIAGVSSVAETAGSLLRKR
jgi:hypothetical protein